MNQFINHFLFGTIVLLAAVQFWLYTSLYKVGLPRTLEMDYSRSALQTATPVPTAYDGQFRLPSIPETRELALHPGDIRAPPPAYGQQTYDMQTLQPMPTQDQAMHNPQTQVVYQMQQPVQVTPTPYAGVAIPMEFNTHSSIPNEAIWFNMSVAKGSVAQFFVFNC